MREGRLEAAPASVGDEFDARRRNRRVLDRHRHGTAAIFDAWDDEKWVSKAPPSGSR